MSCNGNVYNIGMGCCEPVLGPVENYYTKPTIDRKLEEITSAITSGCCITPEEVDEKIEEAISGITVSGVTEEQLNEAIASAKTEIEAEIPSLSGYATEQWVEDKHYITGVDLSNYALKSEIPTVPTSNTAFTNDAGYLTEHQSLSGYATEAFVSAFTYDKATIDEKVAGGGSFDPSQYYNKTATDALLDEKLYVTAYTPTDLSNYYTKAEVDNEIISAITDVEAEIPTVPTSNTAFTNDAGYLTEHQSLSGYATEQWVEDKHYITGVDLSNYATKEEIPVVPTSNTAFTNDAGYITGVDLSNYATKDNLTAATDDMATKTWVNNQGYLTEHQSLTAYSTTQEVNTMINQSVSGKQDTLSAGTNITIVDNVISAQGGGKAIKGGRGITVTTGTTADTVSFNLPISAGTGAYSLVEGINTTANGEYGAHAEGDGTTASNDSAHAEGNQTTASGAYSHAEGINTTASGYASHTEGHYTRATNKSEHASGQYNVSSKASTTFGDSGNTLFSVGNGAGNNSRHNAFEIRQNGDIYVTSGGTDVLLQDSIVSSTEKAAWNAKADIWVGDETAWGQISGSTTNGTIYLVY